MGQKLNIDSNDDLFDYKDLDVEGITGSCYCCQEHIVMSLNYLSTFPITEIEDDYYYVFICDECEEDINTLKRTNIPNLSYDILWLIQEDLQEELAKAYNDRKIGDTLPKEDREKILINIYKKAAKKIEKEMSKNYLNELTKEKNQGNS